MQWKDSAMSIRSYARTNGPGSPIAARLQGILRKLGSPAARYVLIAACLGAGAVATPAAAQARCDLIPSPPQFVRNSDSDLRIIGRGSRECDGPLPADARIEIHLKHDRKWWFDKTLAKGSFTASGFITQGVIAYRCSRGETRKAYVELRNKSFGGKVQSRRVRIGCF